MEKYAVDWAEWLVHRMLFWEDDNVKKGRIARAIHHFGSYALITMIVMSYTIYPVFWFQTLVAGFCGLVWVQHILTDGCIISKVEQRLIGDESSFIDPYLDLFHITADEKSKRGILILGSTITITLMSLFWIGRVIPVLSHYVQAQTPAVVSALGTLHVSSSL